MKRYLPFIALLICAITYAQNSNDVLRYSIEDLQGTARFQSMSGAFGALGGDLSAININPAGSAVFKNSLFTASATVYNNSNDINYEGNTTASETNNVDINQAGGALVFKSVDQTSGWKKFTLAFNYDLVKNFNDAYTASGTSNQGIDNYFLNFAQGVPFGDIILQDGELIEEAYSDIGASLGFADQQAFLGYFGGIIDPETTDNNNTVYNSNAIYNTVVNHQFSRITSGYNSKFTLNFASEYEEKLYLGASLNFHNVFYSSYDEFTETGYDESSEIQRTIFDNRLQTEGSGFSLNLGAIAKLNDMVRVGASYQSPTWYRLEDNLTQRINSDLADEDINFININSPINIFPRYRIKTPARITGSLALIFGKDGLLSFDYGYQDLSQAKLGPNNFNEVNNSISSQLGTVTSIRLGGEYRIKQFSLRGGYRFEESPYKDGNTIGDLEGISGGIGYSFGRNKIDFSLNRTERAIAQTFFDTGITNPAVINGSNTNATLSYTLNF